MLLCKFCNKECINQNSHRNHQRVCKYNLDRVYKNGMTGKPAWNAGLTKDTSEKLKLMGVSISKTKLANGSCGYTHTDETKVLLSIMARARGLGGHTSKQKLYFEKKDGSIIYLQSSYEIRFAQILEDLGIEWTRPDPLLWVDVLGKDHRYYPDFKVGDVYIDTKNDYLAIKDKPKIDAVIKQNSVDIRIVTEQFITREYVLTLNT